MNTKQYTYLSALLLAASMTCSSLFFVLGYSLLPDPALAAAGSEGPFFLGEFAAEDPDDLDAFTMPFLPLLLLLLTVFRCSGIRVWRCRFF